MNWDQNMDKTNEGTRHEVEETLRSLASLPPPENLTDRVHARLAEAAQTAPSRRGFWSYWMPAQRFQFAGAAALMLAVVGSTWAVYHQHPRQPAATQAAHPAAPTPGSFGTASTARVPPTLNPIKVPPAPHRKPGAGHPVAKQTPKPAVVPAPAAASTTP
jgi:hypothetical protein